MVLGILSSNLKHRSNLIWVYNNTKLKENNNFRIPKKIIQQKKQANNKTENTNNKKQINQENTAELLHLKSDLNIKKKTFKFHFYGYFYYVYLGIIKIKIIEIPKTVSYTN